MQITVVFERPGCDYFIAKGPKGLYILELVRRILHTHALRP